MTGLSLIIAIGTQNAFVLRMGPSRQHVSLVVAICAVSDVVLIILAIAGVGSVVHCASWTVQVLRWIGVAYVSLFAVRSFWRAVRPGTLSPSAEQSPELSVAIATTLAFTFLNPHVYLDTVLLLGSIGNQYGRARW